MVIEQILQMLRIDPWYGESELIEIAKGKYKIPKTVKEVFEQTRREAKYKKAQNGRGI
jgi:hypothetical protein